MKLKLLIYGIWCRMAGHKWRKLRNAEESTVGDRHIMRICDRCGIRRDVKKRKAKVTT